MLAIGAVDLHSLIEALEDHTYDHSWWFDPLTGRVELSLDQAGEDSELETESLIPVDPLPAKVIEADPTQRARERRAVEWLRSEGLITAAEADRELAARDLPWPAPPPRMRDGGQIAADVQDDLWSVYGDRLRDVLPVLVHARDTGGTPYVDTPGMQLAASFEELAAARLLAQAGYGRAAVSRAYLAAFLAADDALQALGERRAKHARAVALFTRLAVREGGLDPVAGSLLRSLYERRDLADEGRLQVPTAEAVRAVADAERVVTRVAAWLAVQAA